LVDVIVVDIIGQSTVNWVSRRNFGLYYTS